MGLESLDNSRSLSVNERRQVVTGRAYTYHNLLMAIIQHCFD